MGQLKKDAKAGLGKSDMNLYFSLPNVVAPGVRVGWAITEQTPCLVRFPFLVDFTDKDGSVVRGGVSGSDDFAAAQLVTEILESYGYTVSAGLRNGTSEGNAVCIFLSITWRTKDVVISEVWGKAKELIKTQAASLFQASPTSLDSSGSSFQ
jgi:hypothetical protein